MTLRRLAALTGALLACTTPGAAAPPAADDPDWLRRAVREAAPGAVIDVPAGPHAGPIIIDRPLHLRGARGALIAGSGHGHVVEIRAPDVTVSGLTIRGSGADLTHDDAGIHVGAPGARLHGNTIVDTLHGIYVRGVDDCRISANVIRGRAPVEQIADPLTTDLRLSAAELCSTPLAQDRRGNGIHVWKGAGHLITGNDIRGTRDGIYFSFCDRTVVRGNVIRGVRYGLHYMYSDDNVFERNRFTESSAGSALMYSRSIELRDNRFLANRSHRAYGLLMHTVEETRVENNVIVGNTIGLFVENSVGNTFVGNRLRANYIAVRLSDSSTGNRFSANRMLGNIHAVESSGRNRDNRWSIAGVGNRWDDALAFDFDRDGIADTPHHEADLFGPWRRAFPEIGLLAGSPGERALRFLHARLRLPGLPGVKDEHPLLETAAR